MTVMTKSAYEFWHKKKLPYDVAYLYHNRLTVLGGNDDWKWDVMTYTEIIQKKTERQLEKLRIKRDFGVEIIKPCLILVKKNGRNGYYLYFEAIGIGIKFLGSEYHNYNKQIEKLMQIFDFGIIPSIEFIDIWLNHFYKKFPKGVLKNEYGHYTAKAICYCKIKNGNIIDFKKDKK